MVSTWQFRESFRIMKIQPTSQAGARFESNVVPSPQENEYQGRRSKVLAGVRFDQGKAPSIVWIYHNYTPSLSLRNFPKPQPHPMAWKLPKILPVACNTTIPQFFV
jgi:hypothetical protein